MSKRGYIVLLFFCAIVAVVLKLSNNSETETPDTSPTTDIETVTPVIEADIELPKTKRSSKRNRIVEIPPSAEAITLKEGIEEHVLKDFAKFGFSHAWHRQMVERLGYSGELGKKIVDALNKNDNEALLELLPADELANIYKMQKRESLYDFVSGIDLSSEREDELVEHLAKTVGVSALSSLNATAITIDGTNFSGGEIDIAGAITDSQNKKQDKLDQALAASAEVLDEEEMERLNDKVDQQREANEKITEQIKQTFKSGGPGIFIETDGNAIDTSGFEMRVIDVPATK